MRMAAIVRRVVPPEEPVWMTEDSSKTSYTILGQRVELPVVVRDAASATANYLVRVEAARRLLPGPEFEVVELFPGRALCILACIGYRDNDLGAYNEISIALYVRERGEARRIPYLGPVVDVLRGRISTYIHRLPVNDSFACEAGREIWSFPKTIDQIEFRETGGRSICAWHCDGRHVLTLSSPMGGGRRLPESSLSTYSYIHGVAHKTRFVTRADAVGFQLGGAELELGPHPIADELRALGLPKRPLMSVWMGRMYARFEAPQKLSAR
jgi:hypothetical protein